VAERRGAPTRERRRVGLRRRIAAPCLRRRVGAPPLVGAPVASPHVGVGASGGAAEVGGDRPSWNTPPTLLRARGGRGRWVADRRGTPTESKHVRGDGGGWWPNIVVHPPRDCEREGRRWVAAERYGTPPTRLRARGAEVGGGRVSWYTPHAIARARGGGEWRPNVVIHPPRDCEREGRRWVVAERCGTPPTHERLRARGAEVGGGRVSHPHAIASARGGGEWRPNVVIHPPRDCEHEGMSVTWRGWRGREGRQPSRGRQACGPRRCRGPPKARVTGVRRWFWSASRGTSGGPVEIVHIQDQAWFHWISGGGHQDSKVGHTKKNPKSTTSCDMFNSNG
jgi:hypothetical protein